jgi:DNA mismatch repair protein MutH
VVAKNPESTKGLFRQAKSLAGLGFTEKATKIIEGLIAKNPNGKEYSQFWIAAQIR